MLYPAAGSIPYEAQWLFLCVDRYEKERMEARLYSAAHPNGEAVHTLMDFARALDETLDALGLAAYCEEPRSLLGRKRARRIQRGGGKYQRYSVPPAGRLATFGLRVRFRQNVSWQGEVVWQEQKQSSYFRSALELLRMLDEVLIQQTAQAVG